MWALEAVRCKTTHYDRPQCVERRRKTEEERLFQEQVRAYLENLSRDFRQSMKEQDTYIPWIKWNINDKLKLIWSNFKYVWSDWKYYLYNSESWIMISVLSDNSNHEENPVFIMKYKNGDILPAYENLNSWRNNDVLFRERYRLDN